MEGTRSRATTKLSPARSTSARSWPFRGEAVHNLEVRVRRIDTDWRRVFSYTGAVVRDPRGEPLAFLTITDVTERKWAAKGLAEGVDGLIAVNNRAGGHAGPKSAEQLYEELADLGVPVVCAGGIGDEEDFVRREIDWLKVPLREEKPYLGLCLGAQFLARHLGGRSEPVGDDFNGSSHEIRAGAAILRQITV